MIPTGYSVSNSRDQYLNHSGKSSAATVPRLPPKKVQRDEIALAVPAIAIEVASEWAIAVEK